MRRLKMKQTFIMLLVCIFAVTPVLGMTPFTEASEINAENNEQGLGDSDVNRPPTDQILQLVEQLQADGAFKNRGAAQSLKSKLNTVIRFENKGNQALAEQQFGQFLSQLDQRLAQGFITVEAYEQIFNFIHLVEEPVDAFAIVENGQAQAIIIVAENEGQVILDAASTLAEYVQKSTGAVLPIMTAAEFALLENVDPEQSLIYVGTYPAEVTTEIEDELTDLDGQGFVIYPHEDNVTIIGPSGIGTRNGVYDFLERYTGVRWLMPGADGEDVPELTDIVIQRDTIRDEPHFKHRVISAALQVEGEWWKRHRLQLGSDTRPVLFQENLHSLFPVEKYGVSNPEFYPGGIPPAPGEKHTWQPCMTQDSGDVAASEIITYFNNNPNASSYSLGINDTNRFCEANPNHPLFPDQLNSVGEQHLSDIYYSWINDIVAQVLAVHPDKWFGLLAYKNVSDPPSFPVHERIVPFITKDRLAWIDEDVEEYYHDQMDAWNAAASQVGWYDYMYGVFFFVPRVFPQEMEKSFKYAAENDVYGHYIEMYHNIGDGPKAYIAAKLLWDPYQDVDVLMQEWYERAVGVAAAEDLAEFYELWEDFWTERIKQSDWFENNKWNTYLPINNAGYMDMITDEDMQESRRLINAVVAKAGTPEQQARAEKFLEMLEYYEASVFSYPRISDPPETEADALTMLDRVVQATQLGQSRYEMIEEFANDPALRFGTRPRVDWTGGNGDEFWGLIDYVQTQEPNGGAVTDQIDYYVNESEIQAVQDSATLMNNIIEGSQPTLTTNHSFENGSSNATSWTYWNPLSTANITRVEDVSNTGEASVRFENTERGGVYSIFEVGPGHSAVAVSYYTPPQTVTDGGVRIVITLRNADGRTIGDYISPTVPLSNTVGEWASVGLFENIPYMINGEIVAEVLLNAQVWNAQDAVVYLDDVVFYQIESEIETPEDDGILNENSSFEIGAKNAPPWGFWLSSSTTGTIERVVGIAKTGNASLLVDHLDRGGPMQNVIVPAGNTVTEVSYYTPEGTNTNGTIELIVHVKDASQATLTTFRTSKIALSGTVGDWATIDLISDIPLEVNGVPVNNIQVIATIDSAQDALVYLDDFKVYKPEPEWNVVNANASFETGTTNAPPWGFWLSSSTTGTISRVEGVANTGDASLLIDHLDRGGPAQYVDVSPGDAIAKVSYYIPEGTVTNGTIELTIHVKNANLQNMVSFRSTAYSLSATAGEWTTIEVSGELPAEVNGVAMHNIQVVATIDGAQDALVYVDDFEVLMQ